MQGVVKEWNRFQVEKPLTVLWAYLSFKYLVLLCLCRYALFLCSCFPAFDLSLFLLNSRDFDFSLSVTLLFTELYCASCHRLALFRSTPLYVIHANQI